MRTTIDGAGRLVVPKQIRDRLGLLAGSKVEVIEQGGVVEIRPVMGEIQVVQTAEGPVAVPTGPGPVLTDEVVRETLERVRVERG
jgi:AbrB family looped-hinge helix DNA binding protein